MSSRSNVISRRSARRRRSRRCRALRRRTRRHAAVDDTETSEGKALAAGRDDGRRHGRCLTSATTRMFAMCTSRPCRIPAFTTRRRSSVKMSSASISAKAAQSRAAKCARNRSTHSACRVFQPRRLRLQFLKAGERGVEVCLVEDLRSGRSGRLRQSEEGSFATRRRSLLARSHSPDRWRPLRNR